MKKRLGRVFTWGLLAVLMVLTLTVLGDKAYADGSAKLASTTHRLGMIQNADIELTDAKRTCRAPVSSYASQTPGVVTLVDNQNQINVAYQAKGTLTIQKYNPDTLERTEKFTVSARYPLFGDVVCDSDGYYYVVWGQDDDQVTNCVTMCVSKYNNKGVFQKEILFKGFDTSPIMYDDWGTMLPFDAGNCDATIHNGILVVNYAREMYTGHQSNMMFYVKCSDMTRVSGDTAYTSHSFDQRVYTLSDGIMALNHGDAYSRGFHITKLTYSQSEGYTADGNLYSYHFREGPNRPYGYNETFAQLGGLAEVSGGYVFAGSSDRLLSVEPAPGNYYFGHYGARDLFIQILKKDFKNYKGANQYAVAGDTRSCVGTKPASAATELQLKGDEVDYGILWLTAYDEDHYAVHPHILAVDSNKIGILWEKASYSSSWYGDDDTYETYYAEIDGKGNVCLDTVRVPDVLLASDTDPVYLNGKIYWATSDTRGDCLHALSTNSCDFDNQVAAPKGIGLYNDAPVLEVGQKFKVETLIVPENAYDKTLIWSSSDPSIVSVDNAGNLTAKKLGTAEITVRTLNHVTKKIPVRVVVYPTKITLKPTSLNMVKGNSSGLTVKLSPSNTTETKVTFKSEDPSVATVSSDGTVTAKGIGKTTITATTVNGLTATCQVVSLIDNNPENPFADVNSTGGWQYKPAKYVYDRGIMNGKGEVIPGKVLFAPDGKLTRAEFVRLLYNLENAPAVEFFPKFRDVPEGMWYSNAVVWASDNNIVAGKGAVFDPNGLADREQLAVMFYHYAEFKNIDTEAPGTVPKTVNDFEDASKVSSWAVKALNWALANGIMTGKNTKIDPKGKATRAECAAMMQHYLEYAENADVLVSVPNVVGMSEILGPVNVLHPLGFGVDYVYEFSDTVEKGIIMSQNPEPGTKVKYGSLIVVTVSNGHAGPIVPNVVGMTVKKAKETMTKAGIEMIVMNGPAKDNYIIESQHVEPGTQLSAESPSVPVTQKAPSTKEKSDKEETDVPDDDDTNPENPEIVDPQAPDPDVVEPETEDPKVEETDTEEPKTENPDTEDKKTEEPKTENPDTEDKKVEETNPENPKTEIPDSVEPETEQKVSEDSE